MQKIKKPLCAYLLFAQEQRPSFSYLKASDQMKEIGKLWHALDP